MHADATEYQQRAEDCLLALFHGIDPKTQEQLAEPGVLADPDVMRALMLAVKALEAKRIAKAPALQGDGRRGKPWNQEEDRTLTESFAQGESLSEIIRRLRRSPEGIYARLVRLELAKARDQARSLLAARAKRGRLRDTAACTFARDHALP